MRMLWYDERAHSINLQCDWSDRTVTEVTRNISWHFTRFESDWLAVHTARQTNPIRSLYQTLRFLRGAGYARLICWKEQDCGGGSVWWCREGRSLASLGRPRDILRYNVRLLVMRLSPIASVGTDQCAIFRIVATVIDYFSLLVTACHRAFTYHCLAPVLAEKNEHRLVLFAGKSEHHLNPVNT